MNHARLPDEDAGRESADARERDEAKRGRGALDPGLKEQFERDDIVVRDHPSTKPHADALQRPHYEPEPPPQQAPPARSR